MKIKKIVKLIEGLTILGNEEVDIDSLGLCNREYVDMNILSYATSKKYVNNVINNHSVKALIVSEDISDSYKEIMFKRDGALLICTYASEMTFYRLHIILLQLGNFYDLFEFNSQIGNNCTIDKTVKIYPGVIIGDNVKIGEYSVIRPGTTISNNTEIGSFATIGAEGFQIIKDYDGIPYHVKHAGGVEIGENCYIGNHVNICNGLFREKTFIGNNVMIDNLIHVAHNCRICDKSVVTAGTILCGSSALMEGSWIGTNSTVLNQVVVGENSVVGIGSVVTRNVTNNSIVYGVPAKKA